jgi:hypothetical protein
MHSLHLLHKFSLLFSLAKCPPGPKQAEQAVTMRSCCSETSLDDISSLIIKVAQMAAQLENLHDEGLSCNLHKNTFPLFVKELV